MPKIKTAKAYGAIAAAAHGQGRLGIPQEAAEKMLHETPPEQRSQFARQIAKKRKIRLRRKRS